MLKVSNFRGVKNQFIIEDKGKIILQSYDSFICELKIREIQGNKIVKLGKNWNYSRTTLKYLKQFLEEYLWDTPYTTKKDFEEYLNDNFRQNEDGTYINIRD